MPNTSKNPQKNTPAPAIRAYLGGSFDPVHDGHLQMAMTVYQRLLPIAKQQQRTLHVSLLPNARSPFKEKSTDPKHRLAMLKLATLNTPLQINELELWQTPPVYTIDSVRTLRQRYPYDSLIFIIGMDSALSLSKWKNGLELTDYVNLWVFNRDDLSDINNKNNRLLATTTHSTKKTLVAQDTMNLHIQLPAQLQSLRIDAPIDLLQPTSQASTNSRLLKNTHQGHIYIDSHPIATISSTQIRQQLQPTENRSNIMSAAARQMTSIAPINDIIDNTAPNPLAKWLNPAVYQYIIAHQLYSAAQFR
ncbi:MULTISPECIES: nicotinate-nicotinamide nucleotide adenylyltransferase [unclassified Psychrobacter]|uniref:nicotinate-nicotinamide nucleotide adenylyltransferase n=1 Tax=unclassified Psychrobacter TaxID=196806 RepID=UPI000ECFF88E|nr:MULTISPECIES: nicotinate-nicotinamide nucleotide adenylyltransferase [unclassified Psychrobacter]MBE8608214.1 nicotinate-nicotinamide nucleotide adenylyltransferase [Pseudomonas lundensis]HCI75895.1 nicotinate-nicotinamide nucleotide adenylyltransferase [Psychrobacter sp.]